MAGRSRFPGWQSSSSSSSSPPTARTKAPRRQKRQFMLLHARRLRTLLVLPSRHQSVRISPPWRARTRLPAELHGHKSPPPLSAPRCLQHATAHANRTEHMEVSQAFSRVVSRNLRLQPRFQGSWEPWSHLSCGHSRCYTPSILYTRRMPGFAETHYPTTREMPPIISSSAAVLVFLFPCPCPFPQKISRLLVSSPCLQHKSYKHTSPPSGKKKTHFSLSHHNHIHHLQIFRNRIMPPSVFM